MASTACVLWSKWWPLTNCLQVLTVLYFFKVKTTYNDSIMTNNCKRYLTAHVEHILSVANQHMYLLGQLKSQGLSCYALHIVFTAIVLSVVTYALPSFAAQLSKGDKARIDSLFRKAFRRGFCFFHFSMDYDFTKSVVLSKTSLCALFRRGFCCQTFSIDDLISAGDKKLFRQMSIDCLLYTSDAADE